MYTSYFAKYKGENGISISVGKPSWYNGREYRKLAPPWWLVKKYKEDLNEEYYKEHYYKEILSKLAPIKVYEELGENAVLLCYEKSNVFCRRHLVAEWLKNELGIEVTEF